MKQKVEIVQDLQNGYAFINLYFAPLPGAGERMRI